MISRHPARTDINVLPSRQLELTITHDVIKGVTPQMPRWWFCHIADTMEYGRSEYHRSLVWHPFDHIYYKDVSRAPDGTETRRHRERSDAAPGERSDVETINNLYSFATHSYILRMRHRD